MKCQHTGCTADGENLAYPDGTPAYFCFEHQGAAGFCWGCGAFWGGVESFHSHEPRHLCDDCRHNVDIVGHDDLDECAERWNISEWLEYEDDD